MGIMILTIGKEKNDIYNILLNDYIKRIGRYTNIEIKYLKDYGKYKENKSLIIANESKKILNSINKKHINILLDKEGIQKDSEEFSLLLENSNLCFIIGGIFGVNEDIKRNVDIVLSFSKMTLPHKLARIILAEQIYRGFTIKQGEKYHK